MEDIEKLVDEMVEYDGEGKFYANFIEKMDFQDLSKKEIKFRLCLLVEIMEDGSMMPDSKTLKNNLLKLLINQE